MNINLYHGTSKIFLDSIIEHGLGGINPNYHFKNLDLLKFLHKEAEVTISTNSEYIKLKPELTAIVNQTDLSFKNNLGEDLSVNYRHDGIYAAYSRERAAIYACDNIYGSEILEYCIRLFLLIKGTNKNFKLPSELNLFRIENYINIEHKPIMVEILNIKDFEVDTENGKKGNDALYALRTTISQLTTRERFEELQFLNFKLLNPIPTDRLKFYEIEFSSRPTVGDFEWSMTEITCM
jgi:hypothetical protein